MKNKYILSSSNFKLFLYLFLFWSLAVAQPLMTLFGEQPVFLIAHEVRGWSLILMTLVLNFIPPVILWITILLSGLISHVLKEALSKGFIVIMLVLFLLPFVKDLHIYLGFVSVILISIAILFFLLKIQLVRDIALWFSPVSLVFILIFWFFSPASGLISTQGFYKSNTGSESQGPIFVFMLDEFPLLSILKSKGKIDTSRFPTFAKIAEDFTWYPNTTAISSVTDISVPAILSGIEPKDSSYLGTFQQYPQNIFTQISASHSIHAKEYATNMCPPHLCVSGISDPYRLLIEDSIISYLHIIYPQSLIEHLPPIGDRWIGYLREMKNEEKERHSYSERLAEFKDFINTIDNYQENTLHYLHILLPHSPWRILPDLTLYGFFEKDGTPGELDRKDSGERKIPSLWENNTWSTQLSWRRHLLQVGAADKLIAEAIDEIKRLGLYDKATIIIVSDHGSAFIPDLSRRYAHDENIPQIASIPLFIKYPNQTKGKVDTRNASNMDVYPTLMDVYNIDSSFETEGKSLIKDDKRNNPLVIYQEKGIKTEIPENYDGLIKQYFIDKNDLFMGDGWNSVYNPIGSTDFINKDVSALDINRTHPNAINLLNANLFNKINVKGKYLPVYYRLEKLIEDNNNEILVAINGKLVSHCFMFTKKERECAGMIDPKILMSSTTQSSLKLQFFSVIKKQNKYTVNELLVNNIVNAKIQRIGENDNVIFESGKVVPIKKNGNIYGIASIRLGNNNLMYQIGGWAADTMKGEVADQIYVFIDDVLVATSSTGLKKPYLVSKFGYKSIVDSGYQITIPIDQYPQIENHKIRVFASRGKNHLNELNYHSNIDQRKLFEAFNSATNRVTPIKKTALLALKANNIDDLNNINSIKFDAFNKDFKLISSGDWHKINKHTRWIGSNVAVIIPLKEGVSSLTLSITAKPLVYPGRHDKQRLIIYANDKPVKTLEFTEKTNHEIQIDLDKHVKVQSVIIKLEMPDAIAPADFVDSKDKRKLSLFLTDFRIDQNNLN